MATFSTLADFARNVGLAAVVAAIALVAGLTTGRAGAGGGWWVAASVTTASGLWFRYLRFRRLFHAEAYIAYAELPDPPTVVLAAPQAATGAGG
jgi:hypothetical protein